MKSRLLSFIVIAILFGFGASAVAQQYEFGFKPYCENMQFFPAKKLSAQQLREIFTAGNPGVSADQFCIGSATVTDAEGFEADFDVNGTPEIVVLVHGGAADAGCNTIFVVRSTNTGGYTFLDAFNFTPGRALMCPVRLMSKGTQFYVQSTYALQDGTVETKGAFFAFEKDLFVNLISWTQSDGLAEGTRVVKQAQIGLADVDYHGIKEMYVKYSTYKPGMGKIDEKNLVDQHVLQLNYAASQMRYTLYDSSGFDKIQRAAEMTKAGQRLLYGKTTEADGIVKLKEAIALNPFNTDARVILGQHFYATGKPSDAENVLLRAIAMDPSDARAYGIIARVYIKLNSLQQCLDNCRKYLELNPNAKDKKKIEWIIKQITIPKRRR